jgi:hypothetical protein
MSIFRTETDINTGEIVIINQFVYVNEIGNYVVLDDGKTIPDGYELVEDIPQPAPIVPARVTMRQARLALLGAGLLDDVESALAALDGTTGQAARIEWEYSQEVWRNKPFVQQVAAALGMSDAQLNQMFIEASQL